MTRGPGAPSPRPPREGVVRPGPGDEPTHRIRVALSAHLRELAGVEKEVALEVRGEPTARHLLDALEARHPNLRGTIRVHGSGERRPYMRYFACGRDLSHDSPDAPLPEAVRSGEEAFRVLGAIAGG